MFPVVHGIDIDDQVMPWARAISDIILTSFIYVNTLAGMTASQDSGNKLK